jgi:TetR/AcrR family transcriptional regulator
MDISANQFRSIEPLLPVQRGNVSLTNRQVVNALLHVAEHGTTWRGVPERFGPWHTIYTRVNRWAKAGVLDRVLAELRKHAAKAPSRRTTRSRRATEVARSGRARAAILAAAEHEFAHQGYAATRLEDVADAVGVTRPALFHYFPDKKALFDAVLQDAFGDLIARLGAVLADERSSIGERLEQAVGAWVDANVARPALARLILRFAADRAGPVTLGALFDSDRIQLQFWMLFQQGIRTGELKPMHDDPFHAASSIIGTTVFFVTALANLLPHGVFQPLDPRQVAAHKEETLRTARRLLGIRVRARP